MNPPDPSLADVPEFGVNTADVYNGHVVLFQEPTATCVLEDVMDESSPSFLLLENGYFLLLENFDPLELE